MKDKICKKQDEKHQGWYNVGDSYYCQYCDGKIINEDYIKNIENYNKQKSWGIVSNISSE